MFLSLILFLPQPQFTFQAYDQGYPVTFLIMFFAAFLTGSLANRLERHAKQATRDAYRMKVLFDTNHLLQKRKVGKILYLLLQIRLSSS